MSGHANVVWYKCEQCKKSVMWIYRVAHKWHCKECKNGKD